jgi:hypothetical protein
MRQDVFPKKSAERSYYRELLSVAIDDGSMNQLLSITDDLPALKPLAPAQQVKYLALAASRLLRNTGKTAVWNAALIDAAITPWHIVGIAAEREIARRGFFGSSKGSYSLPSISRHCQNNYITQPRMVIDGIGKNSGNTLPTVLVTELSIQSGVVFNLMLL